MSLSEDLSQELSGTGTTEDGTTVSLHPSALRDRIPKTGLREYWYPALLAKDVPKRKAVARRILETDVAFFRGKTGVAAVTNDCPHRGGAIGTGACHFEGTVTCPYHGWTFDETGACVAVLGEGPTSRIPGMKTTRIRTYPTVTLKGLVFVWMGEGEPAPVSEDIPEQFFQDEATIQFAERTWTANWRPAVENLLDSHVYYLHRNSVQLLMLPAKNLLAMTKMGPRRPRPAVVNGRALTYAPGEIEFLDAFVNLDIDPHAIPGIDAKGDGGEKPVLMTNFQDEYPMLGGQKWPKTKYRLYLAMVVDKLKPHRKPPARPNLSQEWHDFHLPTTYQVDFQTYIYSRVTVPIDGETSRVFYYYTTHPRSALRRVWNKVFFRGFYRWQIVDNFSGQDGAVVMAQYYDKPERLSATDTFPLGIRRLIIDNARDFKRARDEADAT